VPRNPDLRALRAVRLEALHEQNLASREADLARLAKVQTNVEAAITKRDFTWVDSDKLVRIWGAGQPASLSQSRFLREPPRVQGCIKPGLHQARHRRRSSAGTPALAGRFSQFPCRCRMNAAFRAGLMQPCHGGRFALVIWMEESYSG
jgi:hypothetical protein